MIDDYLDIIGQGEGETVEFKESVGEKEEAMKTLCAFANKGGGHIFFGIKNNGNVRGQKISDTTLRQIGELINSSFDPKIYPELKKTTIDKKEIIVIYLDEDYCQNKPYRYKNIAFERLGTQTLKMSRDHEMEIWRKKNPLPDFSSKTIEIDAKKIQNYVDPLEIERLRKILKSQNKNEYADKPIDELLSALDLLKNEDGKTLLTYASIILLGQTETINKHIPTHEVIYQKFENDELKYVKREDFVSGFLSILERISEYIQLENKINQIKIGLFRYDFEQFPTLAIREAILNSFIHRDFLIQSPIYINQYADRIEIINAGGFLGGINPKNIIHHQSIHRNELLAKFFQKLGLVERAGFGVDIIYREMLSNGKLPPVYSSSSDSVSIILFDKTFDEAFAKFVAIYKKQKKQISLDELIILNYLRKQKKISCREADEVLQRHNQLKTKTILEKMATDKLLEKISTSHWGLSYSLYQQLEKTIDYFRDKGIDKRKYKEMIISFIKDKGRITNSQTQQLLGMDQNQAKRFLRDFVKKRILKLCGAKGKGRKKAYYTFSNLQEVPVNLQEVPVNLQEVPVNEAKKI